MTRTAAAGFCAALLLLVNTTAVPAQSPADLLADGVREEHIMIPMRDGVRLSAWVYLPPGDGPWPVIFEQRYAGFRAAGTRKALARLAAAGYVVAGVDFRGSQGSEGTWVGYRALGWGELQDGYDATEWLAKQPWSTGKVGSFGSSQGGVAQNFLAVAQPPSLVCQFMIDTGLSLFHEGYRIGGGSRPGRFRRLAEFCRNPADNDRLLEEWYRHTSYDDYWAAEDCTQHFDRMNVPCFTVGSWFDFMCKGSVQSFVGRQHQAGDNSRGRQQLLIGPWLHGRYNKGQQVGELNFPENAAFDVEAHMIRWFDHHLKGIDNGVDRDPTVRYYVMGAVGEPEAPGNVWRTADDWPVPIERHAYYLHADGGLSTSRPQSSDGATSFLADPENPVEIPGRSFPGARDARPFEQQAEVRTFTTDPLTSPVEWTGLVQADLQFSSTAPDTDVIVRISDVYPDGRSILIVDTLLRARYREGFDREVLMTPGEVCPLRLDVGHLSHIFSPGHRIRVTIASTGAPFYEPNPNTGDAISLEPPQRTVVATNTVHHNRTHASRILAPIPRR